MTKGLFSTTVQKTIGYLFTSKEMKPKAKLLQVKLPRKGIICQ